MALQNCGSIPHPYRGLIDCADDTHSRETPITTEICDLSAVAAIRGLVTTSKAVHKNGYERDCDPHDEQAIHDFSRRRDNYRSSEESAIGAEKYSIEEVHECESA